MKPVIFETLGGVLIHPTGSSYICNPPVLNTDEDWLIYVPSARFDDFREVAFSNHFKKSSRRYTYSRIREQQDRFISYRSNPWCTYGTNLNLVVTCDKDFYNKFYTATEESKRLNILNKEDRIDLFQKVFNNTYIMDYDQDDEDCI